MVLIKVEGTEFWIETFNVAGGNVGSGLVADSDFTLSKAGVCLGYTLIRTMATGNPQDLVDTQVTMFTQAGVTINIGDNISSIRIRRANNHGSTQLFFGAVCCMFMRGTGGRF